MGTKNKSGTTVETITVRSIDELRKHIWDADSAVLEEAGKKRNFHRYDNNAWVEDTVKISSKNLNANRQVIIMGKVEIDAENLNLQGPVTISGSVQIMGDGYIDINANAVLTGDLIINAQKGKSKESSGIRIRDDSYIKGAKDAAGKPSVISNGNHVISIRDNAHIEGSFFIGTAEKEATGDLVIEEKSSIVAHNLRIGNNTYIGNKVSIEAGGEIGNVTLLKNVILQVEELHLGGGLELVNTDIGPIKSFSLNVSAKLSDGKIEKR